MRCYRLSTRELDAPSKDRLGMLREVEDPSGDHTEVEAEVVVAKVGAAAVKIEDKTIVLKVCD